MLKARTRAHITLLIDLLLLGQLTSVEAQILKNSFYFLTCAAFYFKRVAVDSINRLILQVHTRNAIQAGSLNNQVLSKGLDA